MAGYDIGASATTSSGAQSGNIGGLTFTGGGTGAKWWQTVLLFAVAGAIAWAIVKVWRGK